MVWRLNVACKSWYKADFEGVRQAALTEMMQKTHIWHELYFDIMWKMRSLTQVSEYTEGYQLYRADNAFHEKLHHFLIYYSSQTSHSGLLDFNQITLNWLQHLSICQQFASSLL